MSMWSLTLPSLIGYLVVGGLLLYAIGHFFAVRESARKLTQAEKAFEQRLGSSLRHLSMLESARAAQQVAVMHAALQHLQIPHPSARVLMQQIEEPAVAADDLALTTWIAEALHTHLGSLQTSMEQVRDAAPTVGFIGTVVGFLIATWTFGHTQEQGHLLTSTALALVTSLVGGLVRLIESVLLRGPMARLRKRLFLHAYSAAVRARVLLAAAARTRHSAFPTHDAERGAETIRAEMPVLVVGETDLDDTAGGAACST